jgi:uncharacterized membrane protein YphA (DoxX/SURF4 family)
MAAQQVSKGWNITLWVLQVVLAASFVWAASMKLFSPIDKLSAMWPWTAQVSLALLHFTGIIDLAAGLGLVLPALLRIQPKLTPIAAVATVVLMVCATIFHVSRGEASVIGANIFFAVDAAIIAWGRFKKAPIAAK